MSAQSVERDGDLVIKTYDKGQIIVRLVSCPFCGHDFEDHEPRWKHFLDEHDAADAGLTGGEQP
ncbi:MAG: hypothetical protein ACLFNC_02690 [Halodesulfurarchaeum sp.]